MRLRCIDYTPGLRLVANTHADPTDEEWGELTNSVRRQDFPTYRVLVITDGGSPNLKQRRAMNAVLAEKKMTARSGVISASPSMRALMSAANCSWPRRCPCSFSSAPAPEHRAMAARGTPWLDEGVRSL